MRIAMIGRGKNSSPYVRLVARACFSEFGVAVTCVDTAKIATGRVAARNRGLRAPPSPCRMDPRSTRRRVTV